MGRFWISNRLPYELKNLSDEEYVALVERACEYSRTRDPLYALPEQYAHLFKFPSPGIARGKHNRHELWNHHGGVCYLCRLPVEYDEFHVEHVIPLSRGGADDWGNLNIAHAACNLRKGARTLEEWEALWGG